jgi:phosphonate transport system substrate-binding protein
MKPQTHRPALPARRRDLAALAGWLAAACWPVHAAAQAVAPLRVGLPPFLSPAALLEAYRPLREHLERTLRRPVEMVTAKDFRTLAESARSGDFDMAQVPAHMARLAMTDWRFEQVAGTFEQLDVLVLVKVGGPVRSSADLRGRSIGLLDPLSLTGTVGRKWLLDQRLEAAVTVVTLPSINSGLFSLDRGEVAAIVAARSQLETQPAGTPRSEQPLATIATIPGPIYVARPDLPAAELAALRAAMASFTPDPARPSTAANSRLRALAPAQLAALDGYAAVARQMLANPR